MDIRRDDATKIIPQTGVEKLVRQTTNPRMPFEDTYRHLPYGGQITGGLIRYGTGGVVKRYYVLTTAGATYTKALYVFDTPNDTVPHSQVGMDPWEWDKNVFICLPYVSWKAGTTYSVTVQLRDDASNVVLQGEYGFRSAGGAFGGWVPPVTRTLSGGGPTIYDIHIHNSEVTQSLGLMLYLFFGKVSALGAWHV